LTEELSLPNAGEEISASARSLGDSRCQAIVTEGCP